MGRPSTIPQYPSNIAARRALLAVSPESIVSRDRKSGGEWHYLTDAFHAADSRCVVCDLPTIRTRWDGAMSATLGLLIPSSHLRALTVARADSDDDVADIVEDMRERGIRLSRLGYVPGNVALMCTACVDASNRHRAVTGESVVLDARNIVGGARVWHAWPTLRKSRAPQAPTREEVQILARLAPRHTATARAARAASGLPY